MNFSKGSKENIKNQNNAHPKSQTLEPKIEWQNHKNNPP